MAKKYSWLVEGRHWGNMAKGREVSRVTSSGSKESLDEHIVILKMHTAILRLAFCCQLGQPSASSVIWHLAEGESKPLLKKNAANTETNRVRRKEKKNSSANIQSHSNLCCVQHCSL